MTVADLRVILNDCGDGVPVTVNGRPLLHTQVVAHGGLNSLDLQGDPAAPTAPAADTTGDTGDAGDSQPTLDLEPVADEPVDPVNPADLPDLSELPLEPDDDTPHSADTSAR